MSISIEREKRQLENVLNGAWGTIGPQYIESSKAVADYFGMRYGITLFSASAALETILRAMNIGFGDEVIIASYSDPLDSMVTAIAGASPVFADVCSDTLTLTCGSVGKHITKNTKAVIADLPAGNAFDAKSLSEYCREKNIYLIINTDDAFCTKLDGIPIAKYADAAFVNMSQGKIADVGEAGAIITDNDELFNLFFAYHNCGRPFGEGCTLSFDEIIGGDFRIAEWQASLISGRLSAAEEIAGNRKKQAEETEKILGDCFVPINAVNGGTSSYSGLLARFNPDNKQGCTFEEAKARLSERGAHISGGYCAMHNQPFLLSEYFVKLTGRKGIFNDEEYKNSIDAQKSVVYICLDGM